MKPEQHSDLPVLYSFRRCPYAMRARLAIAVSGQRCELREIVLRDKAPEFLEASPKGTVPVLVLQGGTVLEESLDLMDWALSMNDPEGWLRPEASSVEAMRVLVERCEQEFKPRLDRYKYPNRYEGISPVEERGLAIGFLLELEGILATNACLFGEQVTFGDMAIAPFVRQFANVDRAWFDSQNWPHLLSWLETFLQSERFASIMRKYPKWQAGDEVTLFPEVSG